MCLAETSGLVVALIYWSIMACSSLVVFVMVFIFIFYCFYCILQWLRIKSNFPPDQD